MKRRGFLSLIGFGVVGLPVTKAIGAAPVGSVEVVNLPYKTGVVSVSDVSCNDITIGGSTFQRIRADQIVANGIRAEKLVIQDHMVDGDWVDVRALTSGA